MRIDHKIITENIKPGSKVLDIGSGDGEFIKNLQIEKNCDCTGVEVDLNKSAISIATGLNIIHGDVENIIENFPKKHFDYIVMALTLQVMKNPKHILKKSIKIAKNIIISTPNFGHYSNRFHLGFSGEMPTNKRLPFAWYETPNIHFSTISDMINLIKSLNCKIDKKIAIYKDEQYKEFQKIIPLGVNFFAQKAVMIFR